MKIILSLYKRLFFVLLACLPISLMAQTVINSDGIRYLIENDHALIGRQNKDLSGAIVIPSSISYDGKSYNVTGFVDPTNLTSWSSNIVTCEGGAFQDCQITSIVLPSTITSINAGAFDGCRSLSKIMLPEQLINIGAASFANCTSLQELSIPSTVTSFGSSSRYGFVSYTFGNCSNLKAINIPDGISALWEGCFMGCDIDSLYIPEGMQTLADNSLAVRNLRALKIGVKDLTKLSYSLNTFGSVDNAKLYVPKGSINVYQEYEPWSNFKTIQEFGEDSEIFKPEQINITDNGIKYILKDGFATIGRQNKSLKGNITIPSSIQYEGVSYAVSSIITPKDLTCYSSENITITGGAFQDTATKDSANPPLTNVLTDSISQIVSACPGEIGVAVIVNNRDTVKVNNKSVYPMMSVFKVHQALALCNDFDNKGISLDTLVNINRDKLDPKTWSPMLKDYSGPVISLTVRDLLRYTLTQSDNNASNLMFKDMVNVAQTDSFIATLIPRSSFQIAYTEEEMSADHNKAYSNYTSPLGAAMLMNRLFTEGLIDDEKQSFIKNTLKECKTGVDRIAAPLLDKEGVVIAHKTGSGYVNENGVLAAHNDVAYICLPNNISYTLAVFVKDFKGNESQASQYVAHISAVVYSLLMQTSVKS